MISHLVFDLDGTLVDSLAGIEYAASQAVARVLPERTLPPLGPLIGPPIGQVLMRALGPLPPETLQALVASFREHYDAEGWRRTRPYPGVEALLDTLMAEGRRCYLLTNKPQTPTQLILAHLRLGAAFEAVVSPDSSSPPHPDKTAGLAALMARFGLSPTETLLVGDAEDDQAAAEAHGLAFAAAAYGYGGAARTATTRLQAPLDVLPLLALSPTLR